MKLQVIPAALFIFILIFHQTVYPQQRGMFQSSAEIAVFARHLYCSGDYERAAEQFRMLPYSDTNQYHICLSYLHADNETMFSRSLQKLANLTLFENALALKAEQIFYAGDYERYLQETQLPRNSAMLLTSSFITGRNISRQELENGDLNSAVRSLFQKYLLMRDERKYNPTIAAGLSAVIPGLGKVYTGKTGDGITAFILTSLLAYITWQNVEHDHNTRAWISGAAGVVFYGGNILGSYASANAGNREYHASVKTELLQELKQIQAYPAATEILPCR